MKSIARRIVVSILAGQVTRLRKRNALTIIGVVGSIGKTSTKSAIAQVLGASKRVTYQQGNYNDLVSVPLIFFGHDIPSLINPFAWLAVFLKNEIQLLKKYPYDIVVVEIGTDGPGQIAAFKRYLQLDVAVVTAITPEHMEHFSDLDAVAKEELSVVQYANNLLVNADLVANEYRSLLPESMTYAVHGAANYQVVNLEFDKNGARMVLHKDAEHVISLSTTAISEPQLYSLTAALVIGDMLGMTSAELETGSRLITPVSGRMQILQGIENSTIIDDSYNASPEAVKAALETLYRLPAPQKIAVLGNMNELGSFSPEAHRSIGELCNPAQISELLTIGPDANQYLATTAEANGCRVTKFESPYAAGEYLKNIIQKEALILVKGSQNKVFAEEAIKAILENPSDASKLVRQSPSWLKKKAANFKSS